MVVRGGKEAIGYGRGGLNRDCSYECIYRFYFAITSYRGDNIVTVGNRQEARGRLYQYHNYYSQSRLPELPFFRYYSFPRIPVDLFACQSFFWAARGVVRPYLTSRLLPPSQAPAIFLSSTLSPSTNVLHSPLSLSSELLLFLFLCFWVYILPYSMAASALLKSRVRRPSYLNKLAKAEDLIDLFPHGSYIGWSGFTGVGYPKYVS